MKEQHEITLFGEKVTVPIQVTEDNYQDYAEKFPKFALDLRQLETQSQFPDALEITEIVDDAPSFFRDLLPSLQSILVRDDVGKAEVIERNYQDDPRFGGAFQDDYLKPFILWNDQPYYINKAGISQTDINTMLGEAIKFAPATRVVTKASGPLSMAGRGVLGYGATEAASAAGEAYLAPETTDLFSRETGEEIVEGTGVAVAADALLPPVLRLAGKVTEPIRDAAKSGGTKAIKAAGKATKRVFPALDPEKLNTILRVLPEETQQASRFPLTAGQRESRLPRGASDAPDTSQLGEEDMLRRVPSDDAGAQILRGFDDQQLDEIRKEADLLKEEFGVGTFGVQGVDREALGSEIREAVTNTAQQRKADSQILYSEAFDGDLVFTPEGLREIAEEVISAPMKDIPEQGITGLSRREIERSSILKKEINFFTKLIKKAQKEGFEDLPLKEMHGHLKVLKRAINEAKPGSAEALGLTRMKDTLEDLLFEGVESGLRSGDPKHLEALQQANDLYKDYMSLRGRKRVSVGDTVERQRNQILQRLSNTNMSGFEIVNFLLGHTKLKAKGAIPLVIDELANILPPEQYDVVMRSLKDAVLMKAFTNPKGDVTRSAIISNYNNIFKDQRAVINKLFNEDELARIESFMRDVMPTLWAEIKMNPSGTTYTAAGALIRNGLLQSATDFMSRATPIASAVVRAGVDSVAGKTKEKIETQNIKTALNATRQFLRESNIPLLTETVKSAIRANLDEGADDREFPVEEELSENQRQQIEDQMQMVPKSEPISLQMPAMPMQTPIPEFAPLPAETDVDLGIPALSPTLLPNPQDREIAMRRQGIGGLA